MTRDQGEAGGSREPGGVLSDHGGVEGVQSQGRVEVEKWAWRPEV